MKIKTSILSAAAACAAIATAPVTSEAKSGPEAALDACVKSFVTTYLPGRTVRSFKTNVATAGPVQLFWAPREYTILLSARGIHSGELIAETRCVARRQGTVVVLEGPIAASDRAHADFVVSLR